MNDLAMIPSKDQLAAMTEYSERIAGCGLFPVKNAAEAFGMLQLSVADGIPCVRVFQRYHLIPNRKGGVEPALKAAWIMGEFCRLGGRFDWEDTGNPHAVRVKVTAKNGSSITISKSIAEMRAAGKELGPAWKANPSMMLRYRCAVDGVKAVAPDILLGMPADVDVEDALPKRVQVVEQAPPMNPALAVVLEPVVAQAETQEAVEQPPDTAEAPEAAPEPQADPEQAPWVDAPESAEDAATEPEQAPEGKPDPAPVPEPEPKVASTRPLGSVLQEIGKRIKEAGLTPAQAREKASNVLNRQVQGIGDITAAEAEHLLGTNWK